MERRNRWLPVPDPFGIVERLTEDAPVQLKDPLRYILSNPAAPKGEITIERYHGIIVAVGGINTKTLSLPDWNISYVEYPPGQMKEYREALMKARVSIVRVTDRRIYFEQ